MEIPAGRTQKILKGGKDKIDVLIDEAKKDDFIGFIYTEVSKDGIQYKGYIIFKNNKIFGAYHDGIEKRSGRRSIKHVVSDSLDPNCKIELHTYDYDSSSISLKQVLKSRDEWMIDDDVDIPTEIERGKRVDERYPFLDELEDHFLNVLDKDTSESRIKYLEEMLGDVEEGKDILENAEKEIGEFQKDKKYEKLQDIRDELEEKIDDVKSREKGTILQKKKEKKLRKIESSIKDQFEKMKKVWSNIEKTSESLESKEKYLEKMIDKLVERERSLIGKRTEIDNKDKRLKEHNEELKEKEKNISRREEKLSKKFSKMEKKKEELEEKEQTLNRREDELKKRADKLASYEEEIEEEWEKIKEEWDKIEEEKNRIKNENRRLAGKKGGLTRKENLLNKKEKEIEEHKKELKEK